MPEGKRRARSFIDQGLSRSLLNSKRKDPDSGQKEPWIICNLDVFHFNSVEVFAYPAQSQFEGPGYGFLRCLSHAAAQGFIGAADKMPTACADFLFQPVRVYFADESPAFSKVVGSQFKAGRKFRACA